MCQSRFLDVKYGIGSNSDPLCEDFRITSSYLFICHFLTKNHFEFYYLKTNCTIYNKLTKWSNLWNPKRIEIIIREIQNNMQGLTLCIRELQGKRKTWDKASSTCLLQDNVVMMSMRFGKILIKDKIKFCKTVSFFVISANKIPN